MSIVVWSDLHPYECDHDDRCHHCSRRKTEKHDPATCALCDPAYDCEPNPYRTDPEAAHQGEAAHPHRERVT